MPNKTAVILHIYFILLEKSDEKHRLSVAAIGKELSSRGIVCDRKKIMRDLATLRESGFDILSDNAGSYLRIRDFDDGEIRVLCDSILANRYICESHAQDLITRLLKLGSPSLRKAVDYVSGSDTWQRTGSKTLLVHADMVGEAIANDCQISFIYNEYTADKVLRPRKAEPVVVSPYHLLVHNQRYYLLANLGGTDNIRFYRMDYITNLASVDIHRKPAAEIKGYKDLYNLGRINSRFPYLFHDQVAPVTLRVKKSHIGEIIDWFGTDFSSKETEDGYLVVRLKASLLGIRFWLLQYGLYCTALSPSSLVMQLKKDSKELYQHYWKT